MTCDVNKEGKIAWERDENGKSIHSGIVGKEMTWEDDGGGKSIHSRIFDENQYVVQSPVTKCRNVVYQTDMQE